PDFCSQTNAKKYPRECGIARQTRHGVQCHTREGISSRWSGCKSPARTTTPACNTRNHRVESRLYGEIAPWQGRRPGKQSKGRRSIGGTESSCNESFLTR